MNNTRREVLHNLGFLPLLASCCFSNLPLQQRPTSKVEALRRQFPQLSATHGGHPIAYLDSAATALRPRSVLDAILDFYQSRNANPGQDLHFLATNANEEFDRARA